MLSIYVCMQCTLPRLFLSLYPRQVPPLFYLHLSINLSTYQREAGKKQQTVAEEDPEHRRVAVSREAKAKVKKALQEVKRLMEEARYVYGWIDPYIYPCNQIYPSIGLSMYLSIHPYSQAND